MGAENFPSMISPSTLLSLEKYDTSLADLCQASSLDVSTQTISSGLTCATTQSVHRSDLQVISHIGSGKYCQVHLTTGPRSLIYNGQESDCCFQHEDDEDSMNFEVAMSNNSSDRRALFAMKSIDPEKIKRPNQLVIAANELATEATILAQLDHENIIRLRGISSEIFSESFFSGQGGFFLILDVLKETLSDRLRSWKRQIPIGRRKLWSRSQKILSSNIFLQKHRSVRSSLERKRMNIRNAMYTRIKDTALGIAKGMDYLHSRDVVLRDLKPDNVGYDDGFDRRCLEEATSQGSEIRLFDFGMAQAVDQCCKDEVCGSLRYMAPEVMSGKGYSLKVDVYSFGVVLFEICTLQVPYANQMKARRKSAIPRKGSSNDETLMNHFYATVFSKTIHPLVENAEELIPCDAMKNLITECLDMDPEKRPSFSEILPRLTSIFNDSTQITCTKRDQL